MLINSTMQFTFVIFTCLLIQLSFSNIINQDFHNFKLKYGKVYKNAQEEAERLQVFLENVAKIDAHNIKYNEGHTTFTLGLNKYSDMSYQEFSSKVLMPIRQNETKKPKAIVGRPSSYVQSSLPKAVDWRDNGYVTSVKDQGQCGSCYAFSATGGLEGQHFRKNGQLLSLSEQNIVDCSWWYGNNGCGGGFLESSFDYVSDNNGIATEQSYPYFGWEMNCFYNYAEKGTECNGYNAILDNDELALQYAVATQGPVSACIYASDSFHQYSGGVFYGYDCPNSGTNHCILVVGYGTQKGDDYWLVKNSWGTSWGIDGYIKMSRNQNNNCQIATNAIYPLV